MRGPFWTRWRALPYSLAKLRDEDWSMRSARALCARSRVRERENGRVLGVWEAQALTGRSTLVAPFARSLGRMPIAHRVAHRVRDTEGARERESAQRVASAPGAAVSNLGYGLMGHAARGEQVQANVAIAARPVCSAMHCVRPCGLLCHHQNRLPQLPTAPSHDVFRFRVTCCATVGTTGPRRSPAPYRALLGCAMPAGGS